MHEYTRIRDGFEVEKELIYIPAKSAGGTRAITNLCPNGDLKIHLMASAWWSLIISPSNTKRG